MTKIEKEKKQVELREAKAWVRTEKVEPDVQPPAFGTVVYGWVMFSSSLHVEKASRDSNCQYVGEWKARDFVGWTKVCRPMYSTRELALRALRYEVECDAVSKLAVIDKWIEKESK